jgi:hypothetical protein
VARFLIQSRSTGRFLVPSLLDGSPEWVRGLREAGGGVLADMDAVIALIADQCDFDDEPCVVDLDRLGTVNDYPVEPGQLSAWET